MNQVIMLNQLISLTLMLFIYYRINRVYTNLSYEQDVRYLLFQIASCETQDNIIVCEHLVKCFFEDYEKKIKHKTKVRTATMLGLALKQKLKSL